MDNWLETDDGSVTSFSHNNLNQYTSVSGVSYSYDLNGNLTNDGIHKYYYDCENRLTDVNGQNNNRIASYKYDHLGRRTEKTVYDLPDITTKYCYDGDQVIAEYENGSLVRKYLYGPGIDEPICMIDVAGGARYYYHYDGLGSVVALSNNNRTIVEQYRYSVFGTPSITSSVGNRFMFTGREYDSETGLYYYRARFYKPSIGRFLQTDPIGYSDGLNLYAYVANNPINFFDPYGLCKEGGYDYGSAFQGFGTGLLEAILDGINIATNAMTAHMLEGGLFPDSGPAMARQGTAGEISRWTGYVAGAASAGAAAVEVLGLNITLGGGTIASKNATLLKQLVSEAQKVYPNKAGIVENHHITSKYLGGAKGGPTIKLNAAYHQQITNEFRKQWKYGIGKKPNAAELKKIMNDVYTKYPLPH